jgi:hypothetical protein
LSLRPPLRTVRTTTPANEIPIASHWKRKPCQHVGAGPEDDRRNGVGVIAVFKFHNKPRTLFPVSKSAFKIPGIDAVGRQDPADVLKPCQLADGVFLGLILPLALLLCWYGMIHHFRVVLFEGCLHSAADDFFQA